MKKTPKAVRECTPQSAINRFVSYISIHPSGCWNWTGARDDFGYGHFRLNGVRWAAHRLSFELWRKKIPKGLCVLHKCDNPPCVNFSHLELGDRTKNIRDCVKRGRHNFASMTHCIHGHIFDKENTIHKNYRGFNERACKICHRVNSLKYYYRHLKTPLKKKGKVGR